MGTLLGSLVALVGRTSLGDWLERRLASMTSKNAFSWQFAGAILSVVALFLGFALVIARYYS